MFGPDGIYENRSGDALIVEGSTAADRARLVVGPLVVSWNGRLISTQIFVRPSASIAAGAVKVTNGASNWSFPFDVVTPQTLGVGGTLSTAGALGSGGQYGTRSKRGAMIVNSLVLQGSGTYTVSATDIDPSAQGWEGYLPFILLVKGSITIASPLSVNANGIDGGPGGGGGGGQVCDYSLGGSGGTDGGKGYTGGGGGGANNSFGGNRPKNNGASTGTGGRSLNNARGGDGSTSGCTEDGGGGTGHPFGEGGAMTCGAGGFGYGYYGGGGGSGDNQTGGGGGYAIDGGNGSASNNTYGRAHGNQQGVPVAGGSGGASGNPQGFNNCGGAGGGGGGAIVIHAVDRFLNNGSVTARGANGAGGTGGGPAGGSGSGGLIALGSKIANNSTGGTGDVTGGTGGGFGGSGRIRYDGFLTNALTTPTTGATSYTGITIDTLTYLESRTFTLRGTYNGTSTLRIYMRGDAAGSNWATLPNAPTTTGRAWSLDVTLPPGSTSGLYYFMAAQSVPGANTGQYTAEPQWVMSQSAANIVQIDLIPKILVPEAPVHPFGEAACIGETLTDTIRVINTGDEPLIVNPSLTGANPGDFIILPPYNAQFTVNPGDTAYLDVEFRPQGSGTKTAILRFQNNDPRPGKNPTDVTLNGKLRKSEATLSLTELDFGKVCLDSLGAPRSVTISYAGDIDDKLNGRPFVVGSQNANDFVIVAPTASDLDLTAPTDTKTMTIRFKPTKVGIIDDTIAVSVGQCDIRLKVHVRGEGIDERGAVTPSSINLGNVVINTPSNTEQVIVRNIGASAGRVTKVYLDPPHPDFKIPTNLIGSTIQPGNTAMGDLTFTPTTMAPYNGSLCIEFGDLCPKTICIPVRAVVVDVKLALSRTSMTLESDTCSEPPAQVVGTFSLDNVGGVPVNVQRPTTKNGLVTAIPSGLSTLMPGEKLTYTVTWQPGASGEDEIIITTNASDPAQRTFTVKVTLVRRFSQVKLIGSDGSDPAAPIDFGTVSGCETPATRTVMLRNLGTVDEIVQGDFLRKTQNGNAFTLQPPPPYLLKAGGADLPVNIVFDPANTGSFQDTLRLVTDLCRRELRLAVEAERVDPLYNATGITYAATNVGFPRTGVARLTNNGATPIRVENAYISPDGSPFVIAQSNLPVDLAPGDETTVDVTFIPTAEQTYNASLCFVLSDPCADTLCVDLTGSGIRSSVLVEPNPLDFGRKAVCEEEVLTLSVRNVGTGPLKLQQINMGGADVGLFEQVTQLTLPADITPGSDIKIEYRFVPARAAADGPRSATVLLITDDARQPSITVTLTGERVPALKMASASFPRLIAGNSETRTITIENNIGKPVTIDSIVTRAPFEVIGPVPTTLAAGERREVQIRFAPADSGSFSEPILAYVSGPCSDTIESRADGSARILLLGTTEIAVPDTVIGEPGDHIAIPIILLSAANLPESEAKTLVGTVRFDKMMLYPTGVRSMSETAPKAVTGAAVQAGRMTSRAIDGNDRVVTFEIVNDPMPGTAPDTLGYLDATVLLGNALMTPIVFDTIYWSDGNAVATARNGIFMLEGYCEVGGDRLLRVSGASGIKSVAPNPFNPSTEITFETIEEGPTTLTIHDALGRLAAVLIDGERLPVQAHIRTWDGSAMPSGVYYAVLTTPTQRSTARLLLVK